MKKILISFMITLASAFSIADDIGKIEILPLSFANDIYCFTVKGDSITNTFEYSENLGIDIDELNVGEINIEDIDIDSIEVIESPKNLLSFMKRDSEYREKYNIDVMEAFMRDFKRLTPEMQSVWLDVFESNTESRISFVKNKKQYRILSELRVERCESYDTLRENLDIAKTLNYDSVLLRFDCTENIDTLVELADIVRSKNMNVFLVYVGLDYQVPRWNPFIDPNVITNYVSKLAPKATGMILNWRGTSSHTNMLPLEFFNFLCHTARTYNDNILLYGEIYYGIIGPLKCKKTMVQTIPENVTGVVINNMGYYQYNHAYIVNKLFVNKVENYKKLDKICQVIGVDAYYNSTRKIKMTAKEEYEYKKIVENNFRGANASTITLLHDGVDDHFVIKRKYNTTDNILVDLEFKKVNN